MRPEQGRKIGDERGGGLEAGRADLLVAAFLRRPAVMAADRAQQHVPIGDVDFRQQGVELGRQLFFAAQHREAGGIVPWLVGRLAKRPQGRWPERLDLALERAGKFADVVQRDQHRQRRMAALRRRQAGNRGVRPFEPG